MTYQPPSPEPAPWPRFTAPAPSEDVSRAAGAAPDGGGEGAGWARWGSLPPRETPRVAYAPAPAPTPEVVPPPAQPLAATAAPPPQAQPASEPSRALVPVRLDREVTLGDLAHVARRAAPVVAAAGIAAIAASMLFRHR